MTDKPAYVRTEIRLRRYCVTVMDNWTPTRLFWTLAGAKRFYRKHRDCANVYHWRHGQWWWLCGKILLIIIALYIATPALAEDYWTTCDEAYRFCERRGYHRDCSIWTQYGKPLSVNRSYYPPVKANPTVGTPFCKENPWHMRCGYLSEVPPMVHEHTECPIPERLKRGTAEGK